MTLNTIQDMIVKLCIHLQNEPTEDYDQIIYKQSRAIRKQVMTSPAWSQKTQYLRDKILNVLWDLPNRDTWGIYEANGFMEQAIAIDQEEREKGTPKPIDKTPDPKNLELLEDSISLENWLAYHGEGEIGPSWWMDNPNKDEYSWQPEEIVWLNKNLRKRDGVLVNKDHVFRFIGKGFLDKGEWVTAQDGLEYLFGVFYLGNDPKNSSVVEEVSLDINLERWLSIYGEQEHPAKMMCPTDNRTELRVLQKNLKDLNGTPVGDNHIWTVLGMKTYKREGKLVLFKCKPVKY